jgi:hypothetical protein
VDEPEGPGTGWIVRRALDGLMAKLTEAWPRGRRGARRGLSASAASGARRARGHRDQPSVWRGA